MNMEINQVLVTFLDTDQIVRPVAPPDVLAATTASESTAAGARLVHWCVGVGMAPSGHSIYVPGCLRSNLTVWTEDNFTVLPGRGIVDREKRVAEWITKALPQAKPG
jgi:hypothetical protein